MNLLLNEYLPDIVGQTGPGCIPSSAQVFHMVHPQQGQTPRTGMENGDECLRSLPRRFSSTRRDVLNIIVLLLSVKQL